MNRFRIFIGVFVLALAFTSCEPDKPITSKITPTIGQQIDATNLSELEFTWNPTDLNFSEKSLPWFQLYKIDNSSNSNEFRLTLIDEIKVEKKSNSISIKNEAKTKILPNEKYAWEVIDLNNDHNPTNKLFFFSTETEPTENFQVLKELMSTTFSKIITNSKRGDVQFLLTPNPLPDPIGPIAHSVLSGGGNVKFGNGNNYTFTNFSATPIINGIKEYEIPLTYGKAPISIHPEISISVPIAKWQDLLPATFKLYVFHNNTKVTAIPGNKIASTSISLAGNTGTEKLWVLKNYYGVVGSERTCPGDAGINLTNLIVGDKISIVFYVSDGLEVIYNAGSKRINSGESHHSSNRSSTTNCDNYMDPSLLDYYICRDGLKDHISEHIEILNFLIT